MTKESGIVPFRWWIERDVFFPARMESLAAMSEKWEVVYNNELERNKMTCRDLDVMPGEIADAIRRLRNPYTVHKWSSEFGQLLEDDPTMHGGGLHYSLGGSWLQVHLDYSIHPKFPDKRRALNLIAFLNPEWKPEWGGALLLCDSSGKSVKKIYPEPGMVAAFETSSISYHGVEQTSPDAPPRVTIAIYYLADNKDETRSRAMYFPNRNTPNCPHEVARRSM